MDYGVQYTISEVSEITGYAPHVLRFYEKEFDIEVPRTESNHRYYTIKEIELIQYIKMLQDKGFSNKQIKMIVSSPELLISSNQDDINNNKIVPVENNSSIMSLQTDLDTDEIAIRISESLEAMFFNRLNEIIQNSTEGNRELIGDLKVEISALRKEINSKEHDVLICENAKLKMRLKEKTFEILELKDDIRNLQNRNIGFFKRIFGTSVK